MLDQWSEACSYGRFTFNEGGALKVFVPGLPKDLKGFPYASYDFVGPGLACKQIV